MHFVSGSIEKPGDKSALDTPDPLPGVHDISPYFIDIPEGFSLQTEAS